MGTIIRFIVSAPLAALVTALLFLGLYNQLSPKPFVYRCTENPEEIIIDPMLIDPIIILCRCDWFPLPEYPDTANPWTNSEKAVKEPPRQRPDRPAPPDFQNRKKDALVPCAMKGSSPQGGTPQPIVRIPPPYPEACIKKGAQGAVTVRFDITKQGTTTNVAVIQSADECLNAPTISVVRRYRYPPYCTPDGKPTMKTGVTETFTFILEE